jgi:hypothetical protein
MNRGFPPERIGRICRRVFSEASVAGPDGEHSECVNPSGALVWDAEASIVAVFQGVWHGIR